RLQAREEPRVHGGGKAHGAWQIASSGSRSSSPSWWRGSAACSSTAGCAAKTRCPRCRRSRRTTTTGNENGESSLGRRLLLRRRRGDGLAFLHDVGGEDLGGAAADVLAVVHYARRNEERFARFQRARRLPGDLQLER